ncbi:hypothetical protein EVAR_9729_1 [Eumeta japonica]|uniref:Secreted protein n=1 Tax=Eumeta variegata TaxID=151549 RepID=A0A4C1U6T5_EUMVA|nr:hypothetical protein EVAR_9729_1 [Eumeta japonica]
MGGNVEMNLLMPYFKRNFISYKIKIFLILIFTLRCDCACACADEFAGLRRQAQDGARGRPDSKCCCYNYRNFYREIIFLRVLDMWREGCFRIERNTGPIKIELAF